MPPSPIQQTQFVLLFFYTVANYLETTPLATTSSPNTLKFLKVLTNQFIAQIAGVPFQAIIPNNGIQILLNFDGEVTTLTSNPSISNLPAISQALEALATNNGEFTELPQFSANIYGNLLPLSELDQLQAFIPTPEPNLEIQPNIVNPATLIAIIASLYVFVLTA